MKQVLADYRILSVLGQSSTGTVVYRAVHTGQGYPVALKVLAPALSGDPAAVGRFWGEYRTVRDLRHASIVRVYEFGVDNGHYFIATEYIDGTSLEQWLSSTKLLGLRETVRIVEQIAGALDAVHLRGVIHCDLKPSNVLLERGGRVLLSDFGIAKIGGAVESGRDWWGTPTYMAPEQARGDAPITHHADIYALGVMTYQMLAGRVPFERDVAPAVLHAHIYETPQPLRAAPAGKQVSSSVERVVMQALEKHPARRPLTAGAFARDLASAAGLRADRSRHMPASRSGLAGRDPIGVAKKRVLASPLIKQYGWPTVLVGAPVLMVIALIISFGTPSAKHHGRGTLAYVCQRNGRIHICVRDSAGRRTLLRVGDRDWSPAWSPDGRKLAFASDQDGTTRIMVLELESELVQPVTPMGRPPASSPSWAPDGQRVAFDMGSDGNYNIYTRRVGESAITQLTSTAGRNSDPAWSPDGRSIAFVSDREDGDMEIYVMNARGRNVTRLTHSPGWDFAPAWSPDGGRIAYECIDSVNGDIEICVMDSDGDNRHVLTSNLVDDRQPAWSPNGRHIVFCRERAGGATWDIWVMDADGGNERVWIQDRHSSTHPVWRP